MSDPILWYVVITLVGWSSFPISFWLFRRLPDRGFAFSRTLGWLLWGYSFWLLTSLHLTDNRREGIVFALGLMLAISLSLFLKIGKTEFQLWWQENRRQVGVMEALFLLAFVGLAITRAANPEALGTEKPMELAFINAILRSETFPPHDPWLSGYAISYYYFGYVLVAMLAKLCGTSGGVAFNLGISLVFALSALGAYGLLSNLLNLQFGHRFAWKSLLAPVMVLLVGNLGGLLEVLHAAGLFWQQRNGTWISPFWKWLDLVELSQPPQSPFDGLPKRWYWWWRASRVVQDYDVSGAPREIIDEFPAFSYILADLHPHVLAMPFAFLAMALALNLWFYWKSSTQLSAAGEIALGEHHFGLTFPLAIPLSESLVAALILGGLAFLNTWDFPIYVALCAAAYALGKAALIFTPSPEERRDDTSSPNASALAQEERKGVAKAIEFFKDFLRFGIWSGVWGGILYLPFYLGFSSQAGGFLPNLVYPTRGAHLWVMFAPLLVPLFGWLTWHYRDLRPYLKRAIGWVLGLLAGLWLLSMAMGFLISSLPALGGLFMGSMGAATIGDWLPVAIFRRLLYSAGWATLGTLLSGSLALLMNLLPDPFLKGRGEEKGVKGFVALLILGGALLVLFPEFFYLRDQFGWRMNTVFKFYYQAWLLWGISAAYAVACFTYPAPPRDNPSQTPSGQSEPTLRLAAKRRTSKERQPLSDPASLWAKVSLGVSVLLILGGLIYTILATLSKTNNFRPPEGYTLDSTAYFWRQNPNEMQAIAWLSQAPLGVVAEAVSPTGGSYSQYARVGTLSGQPIVLGWTGHESQWRGGAREMGTRQADLERLYCSRNLTEALQIVEQYQIRYIFVGDLERNTYRPGEGNCPGGLYEAKFQRAFIPVYQAGQVTIYQTP
jgi:YYY domain-containing protein